MKNGALTLALAVATLSACQSDPPAPTPNHFLSDYTKLEKVSDSSLRYVDLERLRGYTKFYVEPVEVFYHDKAERDVDWSTLNELRAFTHTAIREALQDRYELVVEDGPGVARVRVALTEITKSYPLVNLIPVGAGVGGASMEAEILDSQTREQIGAVVEAGRGTVLSLGNFSRYGDAEAVIREWAARFRKRLDEAHGKN